MNIIFLIISLIALWMLRSVTVNQTIMAKNQVKIGELLKEISKKNN